MPKSKKTNRFWRALGVGLAVVLFWRGAWGLLDLLLFPGHQIASYVTSLVGGILILIVTHTFVDHME